MPLPSKKCKNSIDKVYEKCSDDDQYVLGEGVFHIDNVSSA